jgi:hypothetical protein
LTFSHPGGNKRLSKGLGRLNGGSGEDLPKGGAGDVINVSQPWIPNHTERQASSPPLGGGRTSRTAILSFMAPSRQKYGCGLLKIK